LNDLASQEDLAAIPSLQTLRELNLNQNPFGHASLPQLLTCLQALPQLFSLYLSLYEESAVHLVISGLPQLAYLNGIEIQRNEIFRQQQQLMQ
jgi:hypothetical protein